MTNTEQMISSCARGGGEKRRNTNLGKRLGELIIGKALEKLKFKGRKSEKIVAHDFALNNKINFAASNGSADKTYCSRVKARLSIKLVSRFCVKIFFKFWAFFLFAFFGY